MTNSAKDPRATASRSVSPVFIWGILLLFAVPSMSAVICIWLSNTQLASAIWPADVHEAVLRWMGGETERGVGGDIEYSVSFSSVLIRIIGVFVLGLLPSVVRRESVGARHQFSMAMACTVPILWWLIRLVGDLGSNFALSLSVQVVSLCLTATMGLIAWHCLDGSRVVGHSPNALRPPQTPHEKDVRWTFAVVVVLAALWTVVSFWMNNRLYVQLLIPHGDSAMYEEHLWNVWHGKGFRSYLDQGLFLGEHIQVIHLLLLPFHMIWPSHLLLELSESVALASCVVPIYFGVLRRTGDSRVAMWLAMAWLFYFPMHFLDIAIDQKTFRPLSLGLPFLFWLIEFCERRRYVLATICLAIALSAKEDVALITGPLMLVMAMLTWRRDGRWTRNSTIQFILGLSSLAYLVFVVLIVIPWFRSGEVVHYSRYFGELGNSPGELVRTAIAEPGRVLTQAATAQTVAYVLVFVVPLALLPLRRWLPLSAGILTFGMLSLLQFGDSSGLPPVPYHHFHAPLLVVVFWAGAVALESPCAANDAESRNVSASSTSVLSARQLASLAFVLSFATGLTGSLMPSGVSFWSSRTGFGYRQLYDPDDPVQKNRVAMIDRVVAMIPDDARVASTDFVHTRLTHRERSYDYSGYLRKVNNYQPGVPLDTEFIVIDRCHRYSAFRTAADVPEIAQPDVWELLPDETDGAYFVLKRR